MPPDHITQKAPVTKNAQMRLVVTIPVAVFSGIFKFLLSLPLHSIFPTVIWAATSALGIAVLYIRCFFVLVKKRRVRNKTGYHIGFFCQIGAHTYYKNP